LSLGPTRRRVIIASVAVVILCMAAGLLVWRKFFKTEDQVFEADQETGATADLQRFKYGTLSGDLIAGIPYPVLFILPRVFPDLIDGPGGYGAFGFASCCRTPSSGEGGSIRRGWYACPTFAPNEYCSIALPIPARGSDRPT
jgi:hypothetical protein